MKTGKSKRNTRKNSDNVKETASAEAGSKDVLNMAEAIALLKTTRPTFYRWLREGKIKGMKVGRQWRFYREDVERFLKGQGPRIDLSADITPLIKTLEERLQQSGLKKLPQQGDDAVQYAVSLMIILGYRSRASDIDLSAHMPSGSHEARAVLRYRIDGVLQVVAEFDQRLLPAIIDHYKGMAGCNVNERRQPQDGRVQLRMKPPIAQDGEQALDLRVSFVPAVLGESATVRVLDRRAVELDLDRIDYATEDRRRLDTALASGSGTIIVTGPTGSGKTTVLYACLNRLTGPETKCLSVEDPVEYLLPWVVQIPVNVSAGVTFSRAVRSCLRTDPDVILVGEIRDIDTLNIVHQSSLTGHFVLSTLHTQDAASALTRMRDMGSDAFVISDATRLILAQRLVRLLCPRCRKAAKPDKTRLDMARSFAREGGIDGEELPSQFMAGVGCKHCNMTGYRGRTVICETLETTPEIAMALQDGADAEKLRRIAVRQGMTTMAADGIRRAAAGETTIEEVLRVIRIS